MTEPFDPSRAAPMLEAAVSRVFADMAFIDAGRSPRPVQVAQPEARAAIDALEPASCSIELRMGDSLRRRIADILFSGQAGSGEASDDALLDGEASDDALLELLNVIAGSFLTDYFGPGGEIKLDLPRYLYFGDEAALPGRDAQGGPGGGSRVVAELDLDAEGEPLKAILSSIRYRY